MLFHYMFVFCMNSRDVRCLDWNQWALPSISMVSSFPTLHPQMMVWISLSHTYCRPFCLLLSDIAKRVFQKCDIIYFWYTTCRYSCSIFNRTDESTWSAKQTLGLERWVFDTKKVQNKRNQYNLNLDASLNESAFVIPRPRLGTTNAFFISYVSTDKADSAI